QDVAAVAGDEDVPVIAADQDVGAAPADQHVVARAAEQDVAAPAAHQHVVVRAAVEDGRDGDAVADHGDIVAGQAVEADGAHRGEVERTDLLAAGANDDVLPGFVQADVNDVVVSTARDDQVAA